MPQFRARGCITLRDVDFFIEATDLEDAKVQARQGAYESYETNGAETSNWQIDVKTVEADE